MGSSKWPDGMISSDWYEAAGLAMEFQRESNVTITLELTPWSTDGRPDWLIRATAVPQGQGDAEVVPSVSTSVLCSQTRCINWRGVFTFLLYQLDFVTVADADWEAEKKA